MCVCVHDGGDRPETLAKIPSLAEAGADRKAIVEGVQQLKLAGGEWARLAPASAASRDTS